MPRQRWSWPQRSKDTKASKKKTQWQEKGRQEKDTKAREMGKGLPNAV